MNVELIKHTPHPDDVCGFASRVCVSAEPREVGPGDLERSLRTAIRSGHLSVLEHASFTFYIEGISRACSHQLVRHRMASYAQQSQRYVSMDGFGYVTPESIGRNLDLITTEIDGDYRPTLVRVCKMYDDLMREIEKTYRLLVDAGVPAEDARYILPNACMTNITVTMNGRELRHFIELRTCERAQWEIREVAEQMLALVSFVAPIMFEDAGPQCTRLGYCPEAKGCGRYPKRTTSARRQGNADCEPETDKERRERLMMEDIRDNDRWVDDMEGMD